MSNDHAPLTESELDMLADEGVPTDKGVLVRAAADIRKLRTELAQSLTPDAKAVRS